MPCLPVLGFEHAGGGDVVFRQLVLARIIEPTSSKLDSLRVLAEAGIEPRSYRTLRRRLPIFADPMWRQQLAAAYAAHAAVGPASIVLYDVSTLYFEADAGDGFREPGFSKERRLDPQITIGLLTDATGFPLMVNAFAGNKAETATMLPVIEAFMEAHQLADVTVVADAGMVSAANQQDIEAAGLSFILGVRIPDLPYLVNTWRKAHPSGEEIPDRHVFTQPWPAGPTDKRRYQVIYYQYRADRARRTLRGIDEQVAKAEKAVAGKTRSSGTGSSNCPAAPGRSTWPWKPRPGPGRAQGIPHHPRRLPRRDTVRRSSSRLAARTPGCDVRSMWYARNVAARSPRWARTRSGFVAIFTSAIAAPTKTDPRMHRPMRTINTIPQPAQMSLPRGHSGDEAERLGPSH